MSAAKNGSRPRRPALHAGNADPHILYEHAVQCVEADLDFFERVFRRTRGRPLRALREDFCGTAALASGFLLRHPENRALGIDLDRDTLDWGIRNHVSRLGSARDRLTLLCRNVLDVERPAVDAVAALNFSYYVFKTRDALRRYFQVARRSLVGDEIFFMDCFGGTDAVDTLEEERKIPGQTRPDGTFVPAFTYVWEQARFNPIDHHILCHIHFRFGDGSEMRRAFSYDWRLWTLPELQEVALEAGFRRAEVYMEGWDDDADDADGIFRRRTRAENLAGWVGYVVAYR